VVPDSIRQLATPIRAAATLAVPTLAVATLAVATRGAGLRSALASIPAAWIPAGPLPAALIPLAGRGHGDDPMAGAGLIPRGAVPPRMAVTRCAAPAGLAAARPGRITRVTMTR